MSWWFSHVDKPCLQSLSARGSTALLQILEEGTLEPGDMNDGTSRTGGRTPGQKKSDVTQRPFPRRLNWKAIVLHVEPAGERVYRPM